MRAVTSPIACFSAERGSCALSIARWFYSVVIQRYLVQTAHQPAGSLIAPVSSFDYSADIVGKSDEIDALLI
jgi:hypothetical protein